MLTSGHVMVQCNTNFVFGGSLPLVCEGLSSHWTSGDRLSSKSLIVIFRSATGRPCKEVGYLYPGNRGTVSGVF